MDGLPPVHTLTRNRTCDISVLGTMAEPLGRAGEGRNSAPCTLHPSSGQRGPCTVPSAPQRPARGTWGRDPTHVNRRSQAAAVAPGRKGRLSAS